MTAKNSAAEIRASQYLLTYGPGALVDFPDDAAIMGGVNFWPKGDARVEVIEPRLRAKVESQFRTPMARLVAPPAGPALPWERGPRVKAFRFPNWFLVDVEDTEERPGDVRSRRLVPRDYLIEKKGRLTYEGRRAVPVRFVAACPRGHVSDIDWRRLLPCDRKDCKGKPIWLDERGSGGDLGDLGLRCQCGAYRSMAEVADRGLNLLGHCQGRRPWLREWDEDCDQQSRLLIRTASNAYFSLVMTALSLPETRDELSAFLDRNWATAGPLTKEIGLVGPLREMPGMKEGLEGYTDEEVFSAAQALREGAGREVSVKRAEFEAILAAPSGAIRDLGSDRDFLARHLPDSQWRSRGEWPSIERVVQLHRLREVTALTGFTRFEPRTPGIDGEYEGDVQVAALDPEPRDFPAIENRGEGIFLQLEAGAVKRWAERAAVKERNEALEAGHAEWWKTRPAGIPFPGVEYILLHTLSHLLLQSVAMTCGYPAASIRERIYVEEERYGLLLYTASPDAEGTLGGLVSEARHVGKHLKRALQDASLCSNDPICSQHEAGKSMEGRWLHGAACHGCSLVAETSCEMRNEFLDRALVVPVLGHPDAAFFGSVG